ncbi:helix-turn-helix domain-containing protein [Sphingobacterium lumbrici]|uniref:helix-turn-helix domain-containing protein n=1 Tax=Sphingobacterium lumbrici TaxID=2559600 RepID=UPI00112AD5DB|nr:helix-turn-helix transcriptional regulator [Sphingobacterium lumbrici]
MKSQIVKNMLHDIPEDIKLFSSIYADLMVRISEALVDQDLTKSDLAQKLDKRPSEISKWLNGGHNFTLKSLCKLQVELGVQLITVPQKRKHIDHDFVKAPAESWETKTSKTSCKIVPIAGIKFSQDYKTVVNE